MIDRDQLREALVKFDALDDQMAISVKSLRSFPAFEAARLVASEETLTITKVNGEWPRDLLNVSSEAFRAKYPRANISAFPRAGMVAALDALLEGPK